MALKGDLQNVQLADLFQTLSQNRQEGVLRLREDDREFRVYFHPSGVSLLNPSIMARRRLGDMLVEAGLVSPGGLETALAVQAQTGKFLGEVLVARGLLSREKLEVLLTRQVEEEIYGLFHLRRASFEFREGPPSGEMPPTRGFFHVDAIVLEAARRVDEWAVIREHIPDLGDIYLPRETAEPVPAEGREILSRLDGTRTLLDVSDSLLASSFQTAKRAAVLMEAGCIRVADETELVTAARHCLKMGRVEKARAILHRALENIGESSAAMLPVVTSLFNEAGDDQGAALAITRVARLLLKQGDVRGAGQQLERALALSPEDPGILAEMVGVCRTLADSTDEKLYLCRQIEVLMKRQMWARALSALDRLREISPQHELLAQHYVAAAQGCSRPQKGVAFLESVLEEAGSSADPRALVNVYRQILELDPRRADIATRLRRIDLAHRRAVRVRIGLLAIGVVSVAAGCCFYLYHSRRQAALGQLGIVEKMVSEGRYRPASVMLAEVLAEYGETIIREEARRCRSVIDTRLAEESERAERAAKAAVTAKLDAVQALLDESSFSEALTAYFAAVQAPEVARFRDLLELKLISFENALREKRDAFVDLAQRFRLPAPDDATEANLRATKETFGSAFTPDRHGDFARLRRAAERASKEVALGRDSLERIATLAREITDVFDPVRNGLREIDDRMLRLRDLADMGQDYEQALAAEAQGKIAEARDLYRKLLDRYGDGELTPVFRERLEHVVTALTAVDSIESKIASSRIEAAHADALALIERFPDLNLLQSVLVPVQLDLFPMSAEVTLDKGELHGAVLRLPARESVTIRVRAEGFDPLETTLDPTAQHRIEIGLHRIADFRLELGTAIEAAPIVDGSVAYVGGRDGKLRKIDIVAGRELMAWDSGSVFGIRSTPDIDSERIFVATAEGAIHALMKSTLKEVWSCSLGGESRCGVRCVEGLVVSGNEAGEIVALDRSNGRVAWRKRRPGALRGPPAVAAGLLIAGFGAGHILAFLPKSGEVEWEQLFGDGFIGSPAVSGDHVILTTDTGRVLKLKASDGSRAASHEVGDLPTAGPLVQGDRVYVATGDRVVALRADNLELIATYGAGLPVAGAPASTAEHVYVGSVDGYVCAYGAGGGPPLWKSHLGARVTAAPVPTQAGLLVASEGGRLELLRP
ncbi:MAG: PQQ-binding-like beta-propeller repeat protein [Planctomycetota bacterium]